jgi:hypothetical protein
LADAGIIRRKVYPDVPTQEQANAGTLDEAAQPDGICVHGGFFLGPRSFYERLRELPQSRLLEFNMTRISYINELYGQEELKRLQRLDARFINTVFNMTLLGAGVADQLEDGRVLSGVGGQYNFVAQGHALHNARSILILRSWRESAGEVSSNIVWEYGHCTIPRHLRDIVVTEYGIADLRGKSDAAVIEALLNISDSRFQPGLIEQAQNVGKLPKDFRIDPRFADNTPQRLQAIAARHPNLFPEYPLGCRTGSAARAELAEEQVQAERDSGIGQGSAGCAGGVAISGTPGAHAADQSGRPQRRPFPTPAAHRPESHRAIKAHRKTCRSCGTLRSFDLSQDQDQKIAASFHSTAPTEERWCGLNR